MFLSCAVVSFVMSGRVCVWCAVLGVCVVWMCRAVEAASKPNVIIFYVDDVS